LCRDLNNATLNNEEKKGRRSNLKEKVTKRNNNRNKQLFSEVYSMPMIEIFKRIIEYSRLREILSHVQYRSATVMSEIEVKHVCAIS
jgi:hypothetical protein